MTSISSRPQTVSSRYVVGLWHLLRQVREGNSAIEFALIAPVILVLLVGVADLGQIAYDRTDMHSAARMGAQYFMAGGQNLQRGHQIITASWTQAPEGAEVVLDRFCLCQATENACNILCPDNEAPAAFVRIALSGVLDGFFGQYSSQVTETVRVR